MSGTADLSALRQRIRQLERPERHGVLPFGVAAIDRALPGGGLALGTVHELLGAGGDEEDGAAAPGFAAGILARLTPFSVIPGQRAALDPEAMNTGLCPGFAGSGSWVPGSPPEAAPRNDTPTMANGSGPVLWCLSRLDLYGPGLAAHGLDPARLVLVRAPRDEDILWAVEEGLRAPGLAAVVGEIGRLPMVAGRRLQLAAERSGVTVLLLRRWRHADEAAVERRRPSAAATRWRIAALPSRPPSLRPFSKNPFPPASGRRGDKSYGGERGWGLGVGRPRWRVELLRTRGGAPGIWDVEVADATGHVSPSAALADRPAVPARREAGRRAG